MVHPFFIGILVRVFQVGFQGMRIWWEARQRQGRSSQQDRFGCFLLWGEFPLHPLIENELIDGVAHPALMDN